MKKIILIMVLILGLFLLTGCAPELPADMPADQRCMAECMLNADLTPGKDCGPETANVPECQVCSDKCFPKQG